MAYLGTNDALEVERRIAAGDEKARLIYDGMTYQVAKHIASLAAVVNGKVDLVVITGALAHSPYLMERIVPRVNFLAPVDVLPGENELEALAYGIQRVLRQEEKTPHLCGGRALLHQRLAPHARQPRSPNPPCAAGRHPQGSTYPLRPQKYHFLYVFSILGPNVYFTYIAVYVFNTTWQNRHAQTVRRRGHHAASGFKPRILCVSIYDEMAQFVRHSAEQYGVEVDVFNGGIYNSGHIHALEVENRYDVIISQAGTAIAIQQMVKIPVVPIQITANDIVTPLQEAAERHQNLNITYDSNLSVDIESLAAFARLKIFARSSTATSRISTASSPAFPR